MTERRAVRDPAGTATAALLAVLGGAVIWQARGYSTLGKVFPIAIAGAMVVLCLALVARNVLAGRRAPRHAVGEPADAEGAGTPAGTPAGAPARGSNWRRAALLAVMAAWIALLPVLGFYAASLAGFVGCMAVAIHERVGRREAAVLAVAALVLPLGFWLLMVEVLRIPVPRGLLF